MSVTVIIGGQYGSEGKGKVAHRFALERGATMAVRTGGPNAGHTVIDANGPLVLRQLPTAAVLPNVICALGPGSYIDPDILLEELSKTGLQEERLMVDPNAMVISPDDKEQECQSGLRELIGSTQSGTGAAVYKRLGRKAESCLAKNDERLGKFIKPVAKVLRAELNNGCRVVLEGTQGFGLSPLHSPTYPYVTSRDTTAGAFISEAGLSPRDVDEIVMVLRAFPIRVSGNSGPLLHETDWETVASRAGSPNAIVEYTSVTRKVRRVASFDASIVRDAIVVNSPTHIVMNHLDYVDAQSRIINSPTIRVKEFLEKVEAEIGRSINYLGFGPASLVSNELTKAVSV